MDSRSIDEQFRFAVSAIDASDVGELDVLTDAGAALDGNSDNALVNGNFDAAAPARRNS